jgi:hypothetical protein
MPKRVSMVNFGKSGKSPRDVLPELPQGGESKELADMCVKIRSCIPRLPFSL